MWNRQDPLDPIVALNMGRIKLLNQEWEASNPWFDRCLAISPNNAQAHYYKALFNAVRELGETSESMSQQAIALSPIDPLLYGFLGSRALGYLAQGQNDAAREWGEKAANAPRAHHLISVIAALCCLAAGDKAVAGHWIQKVQSTTPNFHAEQFLLTFPVRDPAYRTRMAALLTEASF